MYTPRFLPSREATLATDLIDVEDLLVRGTVEPRRSAQLSQVPHHNADGDVVNQRVSRVDDGRGHVEHIRGGTRVTTQARRRLYHTRVGVYREDA